MIKWLNKQWDFIGILFYFF